MCKEILVHNGTKEARMILLGPVHISMGRNNGMSYVLLHD